MRDEIQHWHMDVLSHHNNTLYSTLIHPHHLTSKNQKIVTLTSLEETDDQNKPVRYRVQGYFARKNRQLYIFDEAHVGKSEDGKGMLEDFLPVKPGEEFQEFEWEDNKVLRPLAPVPVRIRPEPDVDFRVFIDDFLPFEHTNPVAWKLLKIIAVASFASKTFVCISTNPNFGKSSSFDVIHYLTDKCPVFKPRSVPGVLNKITGNGNMVFDETHNCEKSTRDIIEEFALQLGGGKTKYINGALKSHTTQEEYDAIMQSITFLYNRVQDYKNPEKDFFEVMFSNNAAIDDRFLKVKFEGRMTEDFTGAIDVVGVAEEHKRTYISYAKQIFGLQEIVLNNLYTRRFKQPESLSIKLSNRQAGILRKITYFVDMYAQSQSEYDALYSELVHAVQAYADMVANLSGEKTIVARDDPLEALDEDITNLLDEYDESRGDE